MTRKTKISKPSHEIRAAVVAGKPIAYVDVIADDGTYRLGIATEGEAGYHKIREDSDAGAPFASQEDAKACADSYNERLGLSKERAMEIVLSSVSKQMREERTNQ